jgi:hypothetical protein
VGRWLENYDRIVYPYTLPTEVIILIAFSVERQEIHLGNFLCLWVKIKVSIYFTIFMCDMHQRLDTAIGKPNPITSHPIRRSGGCVV